MNVQQRDVVLIPVIFSDQTAKKTRPAIIISNDQINSTSDDVLLIPLTSVMKELPYSVFITDNDLADGKLAAPCRACADKLFTAHKSLIARKIGRTKYHVIKAIKEAISQVV